MNVGMGREFGNLAVLFFAQEAFLGCRGNGGQRLFAGFIKRRAAERQLCEAGLA